jgi:hypothetical protein
MTSLLSSNTWHLHPGERAALEGLLAAIKPGLAIEIGTYSGGSLDRISLHSAEVHAFDLRFRPEVTKERFPNVTLHSGDSHELLPRVLAGFAAARRNLDFALVDGDHSAAGVQRDVLDLLDSPCTARSVIVLHDTLAERVRHGLLEIPFLDFDKVTHVDLDFVQGHIRSEGPSKDDLWCGLGVVITGRPVLHPWPEIYPADAVYDAFARARSAMEGTAHRPGDRQIMNLERDLERQKRVNALMQASLSWRLTAPLRILRSALRNPPW